MANLAIEAGIYQPPEGLDSLGERDTADHKRVILYVDLGNKAFVDVVSVVEVDGEEMLSTPLAVVEGPLDKALDLLNHTSLFLEPEEADRVFGSSKAA